MKKLLLLCLSVLTASCDTATRQFESRLDEILSGHKAFVGVAVRTPGGETIARNDTLLPMMSVFKFPVALAVLDRMQREGIPLTQPISITPDLLLPGTYSPMRDSLPAGGGTLTLGQLLRYMVSESDNIACDILLREAGGPEAVEAYVRSLGIGGIRIAASEEEMHRGIGNQRVNKARPSSVCTLFDLFLQGRLLKGEYNALLQRLLRGTTTGANKLKAGLPASTVIGHKTRQKASASRTTMSAMWFYPTDAATVSRCSSPNRKKTTPRMRLSPPRHPGRPTNISAQNRRLWTISQK
jgi:beta-lactamase class A